jgi:hypothetical protein
VVVNTGSGTGHSHNMSATFSGDSTSVITTLFNFNLYYKNLGEKNGNKCKMDSSF